MGETARSIYQLQLNVEGVEPYLAHVRELDLREGLSQPLRVQMVVELDAPHTPEAWLLGPLEVLIADATNDNEVLRRISGIVTEVSEQASTEASNKVAITVESPLVLLRYSKDHRCFQEQTVQQIIDTLCQEAGIADLIEWKLSETHPSREICTQFNETSFDFVSRILEEDGIFHFVRCTEEGPKVVFGDSVAAYFDSTPDETLPFTAASGMTSRGAVYTLAEVDALRPAKVTLRDHDFKHPSLDLEVEATDDAALGLEHYDYPGRYAEVGVGSQRAQRRLEAGGHAVAAVVAEGDSMVPAAGHKLSIVEVPDDRFAGPWVVRDVTLSCRQPPRAMASYHCRFSLLAADIPFRPPVVAPRAHVRGPHYALVTGPPGEEIHTDEHGRIKVHFIWDRRCSRDDKSSCWVRTGHLHTSGSFALPRVGWEVLVDFEDGDPDKPLALGRHFNGKDMPPYGLPAAKTMTALKSYSSPGGGGNNEIRIEDAAGSEHVSLRAQKDFNTTIANNRSEEIGNNEVSQVGVDHERSVAGSETLTVSGDMSVAVSASQTHSVGGSRTKTISGSEGLSVSGDRSLSIGGSHTTMTPLTVTHNVKSSLSETVGGSCIEAAALGIAVAVGGALSTTTGGSKLAACAAGTGDMTIGARASTVGGAFVSAAGGGVTVGVGGAKATTVGGAWLAAAGGGVEFSSAAALKITVGGAVAMNAGKIVLKVGGSKVSLSAGQVALKTSTIKLTATGPHPELSALVEDK